MTDTRPVVGRFRKGAADIGAIEGRHDRSLIPDSLTDQQATSRRSGCQQHEDGCVLGSSTLLRSAKQVRRTALAVPVTSRPVRSDEAGFRGGLLRPTDGALAAARRSNDI